MATEETSTIMTTDTTTTPQQQSCQVYGTIPRRVRVIPNSNNGVNSMDMVTSQPGIVPGIPVSSSIASLSSLKLYETSHFF